METLGMAVCQPAHDFTFLQGDLRIMGLHPWEAQHHRELSSDGDEERILLLLHGADVESDGFSVMDD